MRNPCHKTRTKTVYMTTRIRVLAKLTVAKQVKKLPAF